DTGSLFGETLADRLRRHAVGRPEAAAFIYTDDGERAADAVTFAELDRRALALARRLLQQGAPGGRGLLRYPARIDYIVALFACFYAGIVAIPAYPPRNRRVLPRLQLLAEDAQPSLALTTSEIRALIGAESADKQLGRRIAWVVGEHAPETTALQ